MNPIKVRFVISQLSEEEIDMLKNSQTIISKMILPPDDFKLFNYKEGDAIEVETGEGNRMWCKINSMEIVEHSERVIIIFTLEYAMQTVPN